LESAMDSANEGFSHTKPCTCRPLMGVPWQEGSSPVCRQRRGLITSRRNRSTRCWRSHQDRCRTDFHPVSRLSRASRARRFATSSWTGRLRPRSRFDSWTHCR